MRLKLNNKYKVLIGSLVFSTGLTTLYDASSLAYSKDVSYLSNINLINRSTEQSENIDITNKSIIKSYGGSSSDYFNSVIETSDGGLVAVGYTYSSYPEWTNKGSDDCMIVKYNKYGEQEWSNFFGGSNYDKFNSVVETSDGGFMVVGYGNSTTAEFTNKGSYDSFIIKYDKDGNQKWIKNCGGSDYDAFYSIIKTDDNNIIICGASRSANMGFVGNGSNDAIIAKYDEDGNQIWIKNYGGYSHDYFKSLITTSDGGFIAVGDSSSTTSDFTNKGYSDGFIVKMDRDGNQQWSNNFGGSKYDYFYSVVETSDNGYIAVGESESTNAGFLNKGKNDAVIVKYSSEGNQQWIKSFGGSNYDYFYSVLKTDTNDILVAGYTYSSNAGFISNGSHDGVIVKYDEDGNQGWIKNFGGSSYEYIYSISKTSNNGFIIAGSSSSTGISENGSIDAVIIKYDDNCKHNESLFLSVNSFDKNISNDDRFTSVTELSDGSYIAVGYSHSSNIGFNSNGGEDALLVKYNKNGTIEWIKNFGGSGNDGFNYIVKTGDGGFITAGYSYSTDTDYINKGNADAVIVKYNKDGEKEWIKSFGGSDTESFYSIKETSDKGFIALGYSSSSNAGFINNGNGDAIMVKYSKDGEEEWIKSFGGSNNDYFKRAIEISDGGFAVIGYSNSTDAGFTNKGDTDCFIIKYNKDGNQEWIKSFGGSKSNPNYIVNYDYFTDIIESYDDCFIVVGYSISSDAGFINRGWDDAIIVKYDLNGNQKWIKTFGGSDDDIFYSIKKSSDNGFIVTGYSYSTDAGFASKGSGDAIIIKYDKDFNQLWIKNFGGSNDENIYSVIETNDNSIVIAGKSNSTFDGYKNTGGYDTFILKCDSNGNQTWVNSIPIKVRNTQQDYDNIRNLINKIDNEELKRYLSKILNNIPLNLELELKNSSANLDIYIKSENMLSMSLNTSSITFEGYTGTEPLEKLGEVNITINSSLPYDLNAYMPTEITNSDGTNTMDISILNIKESNEAVYQKFESTTDKVVLKSDCVSGNNINHSIDLKLDSSDAYVADVYKTVIKFEAEQK